jgi:hypothetical protein
MEYTFVKLTACCAKASSLGVTATSSPRNPVLGDMSSVMKIKMLGLSAARAEGPVPPRTSSERRSALMIGRVVSQAFCGEGGGGVNISRAYRRIFLEVNHFPTNTHIEPILNRVEIGLK